MLPILQEKLEQWRFHRGLSLDLLRSLSEEQLELTVGENMGTLRAQFCHMARVQTQYVDALTTGKIAPTSKPKVIPSSKEELLTALQTLDAKLAQTLEGFSEEQARAFHIDWSLWHAPAMNVMGHLQALLEHEILHHGQWIVYGRTHRITFPESWKAWGL